ncbi:MAG: hypothetical protein ACI965_002325, partial [Paraglaciecola sp.]
MTSTTGISHAGVCLNPPISHLLTKGIKIAKHRITQPSG